MNQEPHTHISGPCCSELTIENRQLRAALEVAERELADMKIIAEKCLDPEYMAKLTADDTVFALVKELAAKQKMVELQQDREIELTLEVEAALAKVTAEGRVIKDSIEILDAWNRMALPPINQLYINLGKSLADLEAARREASK